MSKIKTPNIPLAVPPIDAQLDRDEIRRAARRQHGFDIDSTADNRARINAVEAVKAREYQQRVFKRTRLVFPGLLAVVLVAAGVAGYYYYFKK